MYSYDTQIRVCYADVDQMGFVYYGNYLKFYEIARGESMRALGLSYREMEERGVMMPVVRAELNYKKPAHYDDVITVRTIVKELPQGARMDFYYEVYNQESQLLNHGFSQLAFVRKDSGMPCRCPDYLTELLSPYFA